MNCRILTGDAFSMLPTITPGSVDCAVTSPPYWMLRAYLPKGHPLKHLELGQEKTPGEYVSNMVRVCSLVRECLASHGTLWLNVGDSYTHDSRGGATGGKHANWHGDPAMSPGRSQKIGGPPAGNMGLIPQRLAIALQDDGWIVRSVIVWRKPACMPDSITGWEWRRCRKKAKPRSENQNHARSRNGGNPSPPHPDNGIVRAAAEWSDCPGCKKCSPTHGYVLRRGSWRPTSSWEPIIMLAKTASYFADGEAVRTPAAVATVSRDKYTRVIDDPDEQFAVAHDHETTCDTGAKLRDVWQEHLESLTKEQLIALFADGNGDLPDVWTIPFEPLREKHYAAYPSEIPSKCLSIGTSEHGYCRTCGAPWARIVEHKNAVIEKTDRGLHTGNRTTCSGTQTEPASTKTVGWRPTCKCADPTPRPGMVLDPFSGSGRTAIAAGRLGLDFVGCELNPDFADMSGRLVKADAPLWNNITVQREAA